MVKEEGRQEEINSQRKGQVESLKESHEESPRSPEESRREEIHI